MEERRAARIGTVSGLALLAGGTAIAAVAGGTHSIFATVLLGMLAVGMGHALLDEIRRQARRRSVAGWARHDTVNAVLLAAWAGGALSTTILAVAPTTVRAVGLALSLAYAVSCAYFVVERRRTITSPPPPPAALTGPTLTGTALTEGPATTDPTEGLTTTEPLIPHPIAESATPAPIDLAPVLEPAAETPEPKPVTTP